MLNALIRKDLFLKRMQDRYLIDHQNESFDPKDIEIENELKAGLKKSCFFFLILERFARKREYPDQIQCVTCTTSHNLSYVTFGSDIFRNMHQIPGFRRLLRSG